MKKLILPLLALFLLLVACSEDNTESQDEEETVTPVEVEGITQGDLTIEKKFYGRSMPETTSPVIPPTAGEVEVLEVKKGDQVEEGDLLATIQSAEGMGKIDVEASADGEITTLNAQEGGMVSTSDPLATIVDLDDLLIEVTVTAEDLPLFTDNEEADIHIPSLDKTITAQMGYAASVPNDTGLYPVELKIENEDNDIKPGMAAVVRLPEDIVENALLIPTAALVENGGETFIYVVQDDQVSEIPVTVLESQSDMTAIEAEVAEGDSVVVKGQLTLTDGGQVSIEKEEQ
ncbi:efflux RND transporter periplasmic adaptor subunit [Sediminibacillus albus]|uniref:RND family efflux transporter, MFP subunit n=1 Tax=Sediminibacillus albus TaxID=407036 RepID=A0A1G8ZHE7_9BACI|nr:efflux RND transporter periplasmic adaptor subunit [Sediminibacillus albus]SDK14546.1 RND family efflux transporter, MFP subunit [Sediminibacillus albus]